MTRYWPSLLAALFFWGPGCTQAPEPAAAPVEAQAPVAEADGPAEPPAPAEPEPLVARADPHPPAPDPTPGDAGTCPDRDDGSVGVLISPQRPAAGHKVRLLAATIEGEDALAVRLESVSGEGAIDVKPVYRRGAPASSLVRWTPESPGKYRFIVGRSGQGLACATVRVGPPGGQGPPPAARDDGVWPVTRAWTGAEEALYSAWIREMFSAPREEELAFSALHEVTALADRNVLHNHFRWAEDDSSHDVGLFLRPDCADTPYFLRAYYAWKRRLPFAFRHCSRGKGKAPRCGDPRGVPGDVEPPRGGDPHSGEVAVVQRFFQRTLPWGVHTGNGRTALGDARSDLYPLTLDRRSIRPGAVYADPYGHILVVVELMEGRGGQPGVLYAVDGQPDGSITRKRFWEGNFLWNPDPALGGSGFKAFRPVEIAEDGTPVALDDAQIVAREGYGNASTEQAKLTGDQFYDRVETIITPGIRDPFAAQEEAARALHEAAVVRVTSVNNGEKFIADHPGSTVDMPDGHAIFETTGAWENYSTPARDLRLLIALDVVLRFHEKVMRQPDAYGVEPGRLDAVVAQLEKRRIGLLADPGLGFSYTRSDGSSQELLLADLVDRIDALEVAYNPNDCAEVRWGADPGEMATCRRRAPRAQQQKMQAYRVWFRDRRRPPRGDPGPPVSQH